MQRYSAGSKLFQDSLDEKRHYKLYKRGKIWVTAGISLLYSGIMLTSHPSTVSAATTDTDASEASHTATLQDQSSVELQNGQSSAADSTATAQSDQASEQSTAAADTTATTPATDASQATSESTDQQAAATTPATDQSATNQTTTDQASATTPFSGIAATIQDATQAADGQALTTFDVQLADGLTAPTWTAADFTKSAANADGSYTVTLSAQGLADLQAANAGKSFTAANVTSGTVTIAAAQADTTDESATAKTDADTADGDTTPAVVTAPSTYSDEVADSIQAQVTASANKIADYADQAQTQADASATDNVVDDAGVNAINKHVASEEQDALDLVAGAKSVASTNSSDALAKLVQATQILNNMNQELAQAANMVGQDKSGVNAETVARAKAAFDKSALPDGVSAQLDEYGDLIISANTTSAFSSAVSALSAQGLLSEFRDVVDPAAASLALTTGNATVARGSSNTQEVIAVTATVNVGDVLTVTVPKQASAANIQSDNVMGYTKSTDTDGNTVLTYTATQAGQQSININFQWNNIAWTSLTNPNPDGTQLPVVLKVNGTTADTLVFTVSDDSKITFTDSLALDKNQVSTLKTGQRYTLASDSSLMINYTGGGVGPSYPGSDVSTTLTVPAGFVVDTIQLSDNHDSSVGDSSSTSTSGSEYMPESLTDTSAVTWTQSAAGQPVSWTVNGQASAVYIVGHYTTAVAAADNTFVQQSVYNDGTNTYTGTPKTLSINKAVTSNASDTKISNVLTEIDTNSDSQSPILYSQVVKDGTEANGTKYSADSNYYDNWWRGYTLLNAGNTEQTNMKLSLDIEPGTETKQYVITNMPSNPLASVTFTYTDGTTKTYTGSSIPAASGDLSTIPADATKTVKNVTAVWSVLLPGVSVELGYSTDNYIDTDKVAGDTATYTATTSSDQQTTPSSQTVTRTIIDPIAKPFNIWYKSSSSNTSAIYRQGDTIKYTGNVSQVITLGQTTAEKGYGTYYLIVPNELQLSKLSLDQDDGAQVVTSLGTVDFNGETREAYLVDLSNVDITDSSNPKWLGIDLTFTVADDALPYTGDYTDVASDEWIQVNSNAYDQTQLKTQNISVGSSSVDAITGGGQNSTSAFVYQIVVPSFFGAQDGIDDPMTFDTTYLQYDASDADATTAHFSRGITTSTDDDINSSTIRLATINTTTVSSPQTQNLVTLPNTADGDPFTLELTGAGTLSLTSTPTAKVLYSTQRITANNALIDTSSFVEASAVTDWSKIQSILLTTGEMTDGDIAAVTLPVDVQNINSVTPGSTAIYNAAFLGYDGNGQLVQLNTQQAATVVETATVTTQWIQKAADGTETAIQPQTVANYQVGEAYTTDPLADSLIPAGYQLDQTPANATGTITDSNVVVTYLYVPIKQNVEINYIDVTNSSKTSGWTAADGTLISSATQTVSGQSDTAYTNTLSIPAGYVLASTTSYDAGAKTGTYDDDTSVDQTYDVYVVKEKQTVTVNYYDVSGSTKTSGWTAADGTLLTGATQTLTGLDGAAYTNTLAIPTNYQLASATSYDAGAKAGTYDSDSSVAQTYNVYVVQDKQAVKINYYDVNASSKTSGWTPADGTLISGATQTVTGLSGASYTNTITVPDNYKLASSDSYDAGAAAGTFDSDSSVDQTYNVYVVHETTTATPDNPGTPGSPINPDDPNSPDWPTGTDKSSLQKVITEDIKYQKASDGTTVAPDHTDQVTFNRTATVDLVTGDVTYTDWAALNNDNTFDAVDSPEVPGYSVAVKTISAKTLTPTSSDYSQTVLYYAPQAAHVTYIDDTTGATLKTDAFTGDAMTMIADVYTTAASLKTYENEGYVLVSDDAPTLTTAEVSSVDETGWTTQQITDYLQQVLAQMFDSDDTTDQGFEVHLTEGTKEITPDNPGDPGQPVDPDNPDGPKWPEDGVSTTDLTKQVNLTIHYVMEDGTTAFPDATDQVTFDRDGTVNLVTGNTVYTDWTAVDGDTTFDQVTSPALAGYVPSTDSYGPYTDLTAASPDIEETVTYTAGNQKGSVTYIDDDQTDPTKQDLQVDNLTGTSGSESDYSTADTIAKYEKLGYALVSDDFPADGLTFDSDDTVNQDFVVHLSERVEPITPDKPGDPGQPVDPDDPNSPNWPDGDITKTALDKTVTETLHYVKDDGTTAFPDHTDSVEFTRDGTVNLVTGATTYGDWTATDDDTTFDAVTSPDLAGYTPDTVTYAAVTDLTADSDNVVATITYSQDEQKGSVTYIDDTTGETLVNDPLTGKSGTTSDYTTTTEIAEYVNEGYAVVSNDFPADGLTFDSDTSVDQDFTVHLEETTTPFTPDNPGNPGQPVDPDNPDGPKWPDTGVSKTDLVKDVTETLHYVKDDGTTAFPDHTDSVEFTRDGVLNNVTGVVTYSDWTATNDDTTFDAVTSPTLAGYTADTEEYPAVEDMTEDSPDVVATITYTAGEQQGSVTYIDDTTGAELKKDGFSGKSGSLSDYSTASSITSYELDGYELISDDFPAAGLTFDTDASVDQNFEVHLKEIVKTVTPDNPGVPGDPIDPDNPDGPKFPDTGVSETDLNKTVNETIRYVLADGTQAFPDATDKVTFTRVAQINEVTGEITYGNWTATDGDTTFDAVDSPALTGYIADKAVVPETDGLTADSDDVNVTVTYDKLGSWVPNLPDVPATQYPNDPDDPSKPDDPTDPNYPTIPYEPGYTPTDPNGDPLTPVDPDDPNKGYIPPTLPNDPTTDTPITYVKDIQKASVTYIDDTTGKTLNVDDLTGESATTSDYTTDAEITDYENAGYTLVSSDFPADGLTFDSDQTVDQAFTVHLEQTLKTVTPDNPGEPGQPVDPDNPDGPKYPDTGTSLTDLQKVVTQVIHYVKDDGSQAFADANDQVTFIRTGTLNEVTGAITYTPWVATDDDTTFDAVDSPALSGYVADKASVPATTGLTQDSQDIETTVTYTKLGAWVPNLPDVPATTYPNDPDDPSKPDDPSDPNYPTIPYEPGYTPEDPNGDPLTPVDPDDPNKGYIPPTIPDDPSTNTPITYVKDNQKASVTYIDDTTGATLVTDSLNGDSDTTSDYSTAARISAYKLQGYTLVSDDFPADGLTFDEDQSVDQNFEVHLSETMKTVTPDNPGQPGEPVDPDNPDGPKYPDTGTNKSDLEKTITQVIHYVKKNGGKAFDDANDSVTFTRTGTLNEVTGAITYSAWTATDNDTTFDDVPSPELTGYTADKADVPATTGLTADSDNIETTVTYTQLGAWVPNLPDVPSTTYPNDPSDPSQPLDPTDPSYPTLPYEPGYTPQGPDGNPLKPVDPSDPKKGYIPPTLPTDPSTDTPITYVADEQKAVIKYIDDTTGKTLVTDSLTGDSDSDSDYTTADRITSYENKGYELVSDDFPEAGLTFDDDDDALQSFEVHLSQKTAPISPEDPGQPGEPIDPNTPDGPKWPDTGANKTDLTKTVTEVIHYVKSDGSQAFADKTDEVSFSRTGTINEVTGVITYDPWTADNDDTTFDAVDSPDLSGYLADKANVPAVTDLTADSDNVETTVTYTRLGAWVPNVPDVPTITYPNDPTDPSQPEDPTDPNYPTIPYKPGYTPSDPNGDPLKPVDPTDPKKGYIPPTLPDDPSTNTPITYTADDQKATVTFIDDTTGTTLKSTSLTGGSDTKSSYTPDTDLAAYELAGYKVVSNNFPVDGLTFDDDDSADQSYEIHLTELTKTVTPDNPGEPGQPIDPDNPDGPKYPDTGVSKSDLTATVTQTIHYVKDDGSQAFADNTDEVSFTRNGTINEVTGEITYTPWVATDDDTTFDEVTSPDLKGYLVDKSSVPATTGLTADSKDQDITVTYTKLGSWVPTDPSIPSTQYPNDPDDPSEPLDPSDPNYPVLPGKPGYTPLDPKGNPLQPVDPNDPNKGYIPPTLPDDPSENTQITYQADSQKATVTYVDDTTGKTLKIDSLTGDSDAKSDYTPTATLSAFAELGYSVVSNDFPVDGLTFDHDDTTDQAYTIHLTEDSVTITPDDPGDPGQPIDPDDPNGPKWPDTGVSKSDLTQSVTRTIHYVKDGNEQAFDDNVDTVTFTRTGKVNEVTGAVTYTDWVADNDDTTFDAVNSPALSGYVADQATVAAQKDIQATDDDSEVTVNYSKLGSWIPTDPSIPSTQYPNDPDDPSKPDDPSDPDFPTIPYKPGYTPTDPNGDPLTPVDPDNPSKGYIPPTIPDDPTQDTSITYVADGQKATVNYVDDTTGETLQSDPLTGDSGATSDYSTADTISGFEAKGYEFVSSDFPADGLTFDSDDSTTQTFTIHFSEKTTTATPDNPGTPGSPIDPSDPNGPKWPEGTDKNSLTSTVTQTISYLTTDGTTVAPDHVATINFTRTATVNEVTGTVTYSTWTATDGNDTFASVKSPTVDGYTPDQLIVDATTAEAGQGNITKIVTYTAKTSTETTPKTNGNGGNEGGNGGNGDNGNTVGTTPSTGTAALPQTGATKSENSNALPQTGDDVDNNVAVAGLAVLASLGLLMTGFKKRKED